MRDSIAQTPAALAPLEAPAWKAVLNWVAAALIALVFLAAGLWKITDAPDAAVRLAQARVPENLSLAAAILLGIAETFAGVLLIVPRFRRWGAWLGGALLIAFIIFIGVHYGELRGAECSCFPWIKRAVGPGFFVGDGIMLLLAIGAGVWARQSESLRSALIVLSAVCVFALVSYGAAVVRQQGREAPPVITVDGKPFSTRQGRVFLFFFDPECMHCVEGARRMSKLNWSGVRVVGVPTVQPRFASFFMQKTGFHMGISNDLDTLKKAFPFGDPPVGVALQNGREKAELTSFEQSGEPASTLRKLGFAQ